MPKLLLFILALAVIILTAVFVYSLNSRPAVYKAGTWSEADQAVGQARVLYLLKKEQGVDFSSGPCLSNDLMPDWVVDIAHNPRQKIDDQPQNQCQAYLEGRAAHFVELDPEGNLIRAQ